MISKHSNPFIPVALAASLASVSLVGCSHSQGLRWSDPYEDRASGPAYSGLERARGRDAPVRSASAGKRTAGGESVYKPRSMGWRLLQCDAPYQALQRFSAEAQDRPQNADPKIGYSLAAAELGKHSASVWAMRRAMRDTPEGVAYFRLGPEHEATIDRLIDRYERFRYENPGDQDVVFMLAALRYLDGDPEGAHQVLGARPRGGWRDLSTERLAGIINDHLGAPTAARSSSDSATGDAAGPTARRTRDPLPSAEPDEAEGLASAGTASTGENEGRESSRADSPSASRRGQEQAETEDGAGERGDGSAEDVEVDYERVRQGLVEAADSIDDFNKKLRALIERRKPQMEERISRAERGG